MPYCHVRLLLLLTAELVTHNQAALVCLCACRPFGLVGVLGKLVGRFLHDTLPQDAGECDVLGGQGRQVLPSPGSTRSTLRCSAVWHAFLLAALPRASDDLSMRLP